MNERVMLNMVRQRFSQRHGNGPRYAYAEHVRNVGGFGKPTPGAVRRTDLRTADAIAVDLWPSNSYAVHGIEVKVSRSDWLTELKTPEKADAFKRYCDRWWLVVPDPTIVRDDLPTGWGLLIPDRFDRLYVAHRAPALTPDPMPKAMVAALMRATAKTTAAALTPEGVRP